jgi:perosamine synthetase
LKPAVPEDGTHRVCRQYSNAIEIPNVPKLILNPGLLPRDGWEYSLGDLFRGLVAAVKGATKDAVVDLPGLPNCIPVRTGRAGVLAALSSLQLRPGARIGVPLFCCPIVFKAIVSAGCKVRFLDVDPATFCLSKEDLIAKKGELDALIVVHMFGNICDIPELQKAAPGLPIIEDCAQALGSKLNGQPAGSFGDVAIFSFRSGKYLSVGEGAVVYSRSAEIRSRLAQFVKQLPRPGMTAECRHIATTWLKSVLRRKPLYGLVGFNLWMRVNKEKRMSLNPPLRPDAIYATDLQLTKHRLSNINALISKQRAFAKDFSSNLKLKRETVCSEPTGAFYNRLQFPITFESQTQRNSMADFLLEQGVDSTKYLDDVVMTAAEVFGYDGDCPKSEQLSKQVLVIPNQASLREKDVKKIIAAVNAGWVDLVGAASSQRLTGKPNPQPSLIPISK